MSYIPNPHPHLAEPAPNGQPKVDFLAWFNNGWVIDDRHLLANPSAPHLLTVKLLPEAATQPKINPRGVVHHTQGGTKKATNEQVWSLCSRDEWKSEPHIIGPEMATGRVLQAIPFDTRADSNKDGNRWLHDGRWWGHLSIETQDSGYANVPLKNDPWTLPQLDVLAGIDTAACATYGIRCGDMGAWNASGLAPHNRWPQFSSSSHNCPGPARTAQMDWVRGEVARRLAAYYAAVGEVCP